ncbi:MAG TPA: hypothetical protein VNA24_12805, partial [Hyalangium sp.]|nr:hypothetical protein [Hyalangium sp.]
MLFASILNAHTHKAESRARILRVLPFILAGHILAILLLAPRRETARTPVREEDDGRIVLKLLSAPPALPPPAAAANAPTQAGTRRV